MSIQITCRIGSRMEFILYIFEKDVERKQEIGLEQGEPEMDNNSVEGRKRLVYKWWLALLRLAEWVQ